MSEKRANRDNLHCHVRRWTDWPKEELETEIRNRMRYFYGQTDGTMQFPSSAEGDLLKMVFVLLSPNDKTQPTSAARRA
jgi:hypothetical protein